MTRATYESACLDHVVPEVVDGEAVALMQRLPDAGRLSSHELEAIGLAVKHLAQGDNARRSSPGSP